MWTTNPELAKLLADHNDGYKYMQNSNLKLKWKCPDCGEAVGYKITSNVLKKGVSCHFCGQGKSFPERVVMYLLKSINIAFDTEKSFKWTQGKRYDFYLPEYNILIETHGLQHYENVKGRNRSLEEEQENDQQKYELAMKNGINKYIVIDCRKSDFDYIKNNIIQSSLFNSINNNKSIDWDYVKTNSSINPVKKIAELWNSGIRDMKIFIDEFRVTRPTIMEYLNKAKENTMCDFDEKYYTKKARIKSIVQLTLEGEFVQEWESSKEACEYYGYPTNGLSSCLNGHSKSYHSFKWLNKKDYLNIID